MKKYNWFMIVSLSLVPIIGIIGTLIYIYLYGMIWQEPVLMIIGSLATLLFIWRFYELWTIRGSVIAQAGSATLTNDNALGRKC